MLRSFLADQISRARSSSLAQEVGVTYSGQVVGSGIGFVIQILLQRALGPADYGILALAVSVGSLTTVLTDLGISHATVLYGSKYLAEDLPRVMALFPRTLLVRLSLTALGTRMGFSTVHWIVSRALPREQASVADVGIGGEP